MDEIRFCELHASDYDRVMAFWTSIDGIHMHNDRSETREGFTAVLERNPGLSSIAFDNDTVIAACLCTHDGRRGWISHLAVASPYRRRGIGQRLVQKALQGFKEAGVHSYAVGVIKDCDSARKFWEKAGFKGLTVADILVKKDSGI